MKLQIDDQQIELMKNPFNFALDDACLKLLEKASIGSIYFDDFPKADEAILYGISCGIKINKSRKIILLHVDCIDEKFDHGFFLFGATSKSKREIKNVCEKILAMNKMIKVLDK